MPGPIRHRKQAPDRRPRAATVPPQALESAPSPRKKQLEGSHGDRQAARADALGGEALAVNDALRIGGYLLWGLAGLVLGADPKPQGAAAEVARARRTLGVRAAIYRCGNWFRTVAVLPQKDQALDLLSRAQTQSPYNPYLVEMASWCPGKSLVP